MGLDDILGNNPLHETFGFYFFSLSSHRDDAKQWAEYGDERRGFAIGFSPCSNLTDKSLPPSK